MTWELQGLGNTRNLIVEGAFALDPSFCVIPVGITSIDIGPMPAGDYEIHVRIVDPDDGFGGVPSPSFGVAAFTVGQSPTVPVPTLRPLGLAALVLAVVGAAGWRMRRKLGRASRLFAMALAMTILPASEGMAAVVFLLEVTLIAPPSGPSPESIVEGYDFSSGQSPPFAAISAGSPSHAAYLLPVRAKGGFSALLQAHPNSVRAQLERTVLLAYSSAENRNLGVAALELESVIESVSAPLDFEFSADASPVALGVPLDAKSVFGVPDWRTQLNLQQAWQRQSGWARIGVLDNGYDLGHPDSIAFDGGGQFTGGNLITADVLDVGRLGTAQTVAECVVTQPSTCDANLDELEPVAL